MKRFILCLSLFCFAISISTAQKANVRPTLDKISGEAVKAPKSPLASSYMQKGDAYVRVVYSQPHLRGRDMLGGKNPYGKMWRLGANQATEIFLTKDIKIGGEELEAGAYSMFAIPNADSWTLVFSNQLGQWGAYNYDESQDALRLEVKVQKAPKTFEAMSIWFGDEGEAINFAWGEAWVNVPIAL
ncbi:MAG: DUF2911 domain-containing protein [Bacteroidota bacterium]